MADKFEIYDLIGVIVPGTLLVCILPLFFPSLMVTATAVKYPEAFAVVALTAAAVLGGHVIQAISSLIEPVIYWTWRGRPSDRVFTKGLGSRYMPLDLATRIKEKLKSAYGADLSDRALFVKAMQRAEDGAGRVARFNALYAYHRASLTLSLIVACLFIASWRAGLATTMTPKQKVGMLISLALFLILSWHRARPRGLYYTKEVLLRGEQALEGRHRDQFCGFDVSNEHLAEITYAGIADFVVASFAVICGCNAAEVKREQLQTREVLMDIYEQQLVDNLARISLHKPFVHLEYETLTGSAQNSRKISLTDRRLHR